MPDIFYNKTVTIWNKRKSDELFGGEVWQPTVINNVWYQLSGGTSIQSSWYSSQDSVRLHISDKLSRSKRTFVDPSEWKRLPMEKINKHYTLESEDTFFTCGDASKFEAEENVPFIEALKMNYADTYKVSNIDRYDSLLPHYEVWGK